MRDEPGGRGAQSAARQGLGRHRHLRHLLLPGRGSGHRGCSPTYLPIYLFICFTFFYYYYFILFIYLFFFFFNVFIYLFIYLFF